MELVFDLEANGLLEDVDTLHCGSVIALGAPQGPVESFGSRPLRHCIGNIDSLLERLSEASTLIGHFIIGYDLPLLEKLYDWTPKKGTKIVDTYVMSRLLNPDRVKPPGLTGKNGPHSLAAWGCRLGQLKPGHEDWSTFDTAMLRRNRADVEINVKLYHILRTEMAGHNWTDSLEIEHEVCRIITKQESDGVRFDVRSARALVSGLDDDISRVDSTLLSGLPKKCKQKGVPVKEPFKINGELKTNPSVWMDGLEQTVAGPFSKIEWLEMNLNSIAQVKDYLLTQGWEPTEWNYKDGIATSPKLTEDSFGTISGDFGKLIKQRILNNHRKSQITGWLNRVREDDRLSAGADTCGTNTGRFRHYNVVNVPKANSYPKLDKNGQAHPKAGQLAYMDDPEYQPVFMGTEMRSLFCATPGRVFVGHDISGQELRLLAHYMEDPKYVDAILHGDIHSLNQQATGLATRNQAKTFIYAFLYGAGNEKIGSIVGGTEADGANLKREFLTATPRLKKLITNVKRASKKGWLRGLDNRKIMMRRQHGRIAEHKALNTLLQCGGAVVMKKSMILLDQWVREEGLDVIKVLDIHDEAQADVAPKDVDRYIELCKKSMVEAGEHFNLGIPMKADVKTGNNWSETH